MSEDVKLDKILKALPTGMKEEMDAMSSTELRDRLVQCEHNLSVVIQKFEDDSKFQSLKLQYKEAAGPLRDAKKAMKATIQYALVCLEGKGAL